MIKIFNLIERLKDWKILFIGVLLIILGLCLNPFKLAGSTMTVEGFKAFYKLTAQEQQYYNLIYYSKFGAIAVCGISSMLIGGTFIGEWLWRKSESN